MSEHLSPLDAMFLELEQADDSAHMHIGAVMVFDPLPGGGTPSLDDLAARLEERMASLPRYRQRLSSPRTGGLSWPTWESDPHYHVHDHLRREVLPAPGGDTELTDWIADFYSHRLDRTRPLWETVLLEGLEHGRWALATKSHHCLVDGIASVDVGYVLMDTEPSHHHPSRRPRRPPPQRDGWSGSALLVRGARGSAEAAMHPRATLSRARAIGAMLVRDELISAPTTSLNEPIGGTRRYAMVRVSLEQLDAIRHELGGTINDVVLALSTGGLRRLLLARGEALPKEGLRGQVPVNIRTESEHLALGNRLVSLFVRLPVSENDPLRRYGLVLAEAGQRKGGTQALGAKTLIDLTNFAPPVLHTVLAQSLFDVRLFNVTITNVPASPTKLYAFGAPLVEVLPLVPLFARHAVGIAAVSYAGSMVMGLNADRATVPDLDVLTEGIRESLAELRSLAARSHPSPPAPVRSSSARGTPDPREAKPGRRPRAPTA